LDPFILVHIKDDVRKTQLQRASILRIIDGDSLKPLKIKPQTSILSEGLDFTNTAEAPYYIHEHEVPRLGVSITIFFFVPGGLMGRYLFGWE
jgi:hypothetical protein